MVYITFAHSILRFLYSNVTNYVVFNFDFKEDTFN